MMAAVIRLDHLDSDALLDLLSGRRWFAAEHLEAEAARVSCIVHADDELELALVEVRFADHPSRTYVVAVGPNGEEATEHLPSLARLAVLAGVTTPCASARPMGVEQSNSSVVLDESIVLKLYRRVEVGPSPEVELLVALEQAGFAAAPRLRGSIALTCDTGAATLAIFTDLVPAAEGGWELTLASLASGDPDWLVTRSRRLGEVTGSMHSALAAASDPELAPTPAASDAVAGLARTIDDEVVRLGGTPVAGRIPELRALVRRLSGVGPPGLLLRIHGDYHLGQVLWAADDWVVIDFEGEPGRSLAERRRKTFAPGDVAGMLRSFAYAADVAGLAGTAAAPAGWETACRTAFMAGWRSTVDPRLLPASETGLERLLALLDLQKLLYELRYELANRPEWARIPVAGLERALGAARA